MSSAVRNKLVKRLKDDLLGPISKDEVLYDKYPSDRYLFGILFPPETPIPTEDDDTNEAETEGDIEDTSSTEQVAISKTFRPSSMGLSFIVSSTNNPKVNIDIMLGTYSPVEYCNLFDDDGKKLNEKQKGKISNLWYRKDHKIQKQIELSSSMEIKTEIDFLSIYVRSLKNSKDKSKVTATISIMNTFVYEEDEKRDKREIESKSFFQTCLNISGNNCNILPRENFSEKGDYDTRSSLLIYRDNIEYASGHTCSASWNDNLGKIIISSDWLPTNIVKRTDPTGDDIFANTMKDVFSIEKNFNASDLSLPDKKKIKKVLECIPNAYSKWIKSEKIKLESLEEKFYKQANEHLLDCEKALKRLQEGVDAIVSSKETITAFAYANEAMIRQAKWTERNNEYELQWRPFQLGFLLLSANSIINQDSIERNILDLLWFPTGGGKTEAYLLISCFLIFLRRIQSNEDIKYEGINIFMRYTLRTLTVQQFQRAAKMIISCEITRLKNTKNHQNLLGDKPISIGLWVGSKTTPNRYHEALDKIYEEDGSTPNQMQDCPCCLKKLKWSKEYSLISKNYIVLPKCQNENCEINKLGYLPVYTVDDYVYEMKPTLLIGTIDKFAQITRSKNIKSLLSISKESKNQTPELIIQDELHLISGPLGTLAGLYEIAIDEFCSSKGVKPKIIGSTATIKRAQDQVKRLFNRQSFQFPPPAIDASNSCFAKVDEEDEGRLYLGLTTAGRSQRYVVQQTCASLLQSINDSTIDKDFIDPYTTLVSYYNSLRELGGSIVLMQDDVRSSMKILSSRYNEEIREMGSPEELKGSLSSSVVRNLLAKLEKERFYKLDNNGKLIRNEECIDVLLATNMLSVGVDINRLGLMVVNGQPKTMSEYIQSTSRIGRKHPGLVVSVYNNQRNRDKSHFESFSTWHGALYKDIEATSVTPFAPRAREKALHAVLIALSRNLVDGLDIKPNLTKDKREIIENKIIPIILNRILQIDAEEHDDAKKELYKLLDDWEKRSLVGDLKHYWIESHFHRKKSLMISSELAAEREAAGLAGIEAWATPNSMRDVEAETQFQLSEQLEQDA